MNKTEAFQLFDELPPPIAERAKRNFDDRFFRYQRDVAIGRTQLAKYLDCAFSWDGSPESYNFWYTVKRAEAGDTAYPSVKGLPI